MHIKCAAFIYIRPWIKNLLPVLSLFYSSGFQLAEQWLCSELGDAPNDWQKSYSQGSFKVTPRESRDNRGKRENVLNVFSPLRSAEANKPTVGFLIGQPNICVRSSSFGLWKPEDCFCLGEVISSTAGPEGQHLYCDELRRDTDGGAPACAGSTVAYN